MNIRKDPKIRTMLEDFDSECNAMYQSKKAESKPMEEENLTGLFSIFLLFAIVVVSFALIITQDINIVDAPNKVTIINQTIDNTKTIQEIPIYEVTQKYVTNNNCNPVSPSKTSCYQNCGQYFYGSKNISREQYANNCIALREVREI